MPLEIKMRRTLGGENSGVVTVKLTGSLDTATSPELERQLVPVLAGPVKNMIFDLAQLSFLSSAGLAIFATARKTLQERSGQAAFVNLQPQIQAVFDVIRALPGVAVYKDSTELDRYLALLQSQNQGQP